MKLPNILANENFKYNDSKCVNLTNTETYKVYAEFINSSDVTLLM